MRKFGSVILVLCLGLTLGPVTSAKDKEPNPADFPTQFRVSTTSAVGSWMVGNFCTIVLTDPAHPDVELGVTQHHGGKCIIPDAGTVVPGRRVKDDIELLQKDDKGKLRVERWHVTATVAVPPISTK